MEAVQGLRKARFERETWTYFALLYLHNERGSYLDFEPLGVLCLVTSARSMEASVTAGSAAFAAEERKHRANDAKCAELGWVSISLAVETYGCWGTEAKWTFSQLASRLATRQNCPKSIIWKAEFDSCTVINVKKCYPENTEEAWLKLFMLPMCVLPSLRCKGRHDKPLPVDTSATSGQTTILEPFGLWPKIAGCGLSCRGREGGPCSQGCIEEYWMDEDLSSESGVQQGDPLGPLLFALVLQKLVSSLDADDECAEILLQAWYFDDGALAGTRPAVLRALHLIEDLGPALGLHVNLGQSSPPVSGSSSSFLLAIGSPSPGLGLHLESNEYRMAIRWWLGWILLAWGDVVIRHSRLRDEVFDLCRHAHLSVSVERGHGLTRDLAHTRPADILIAGWDRGKPAVLDLTITSPLCSAILSELCHQAGAAALAAEAHKLHSNGPKCQELGWSSIPLAVETYGNWGKEAHDTFSWPFTSLPLNQQLWQKFTAG
eukprot:Em0013g617a